MVCFTENICRNTQHFNTSNIDNLELKEKITERRWNTQQHFDTSNID